MFILALIEITQICIYFVLQSCASSMFQGFFLYLPSYFFFVSFSFIWKEWIAFCVCFVFFVFGCFNLFLLFTSLEVIQFCFGFFCLFVYCFLVDTFKILARILGMYLYKTTYFFKLQPWRFEVFICLLLFCFMQLKYP